MTLDWKTGGLLLGAVFFIAVALVKPIGVSTQFVVMDGIVANAVNPSIVTTVDDRVTSSNAYLDKSGGKYAKAVSNPLNYGFVFVLAMALGGFVSSRQRGGVPAAERDIPPLWKMNFGESNFKRYGTAFAGGFLTLYGARLAGGCTSGHMMSGMMQTALSGYLFAGAAFAAAIPVSLMMFRKGA